MSDIRQHLQQVRQCIEQAAASAGRNPDDIRLLAVSKTKPASDIAEAIEAGQSEFGENYLQEALAKIEQLRGCDVAWHFIGHIQSNKTRPIAEHFDWVHTVDNLKHARRLNDQRPEDMLPLNVCIQVNISSEASKSGISPEQLPELAQAISQLPRLRLRGLMAIPAATDDPTQQHEAFAQMRQLLERLNNSGFELDTLSMGMSGDLEAAIAEGATMVRIGTAIFGRRN
ncbi:MAG: YggS family pyridoxal phosphate-dependent enzyme [Chromatiales bacterium]|jgi:pyridoxal phosphate enzyme (YggS family)